MKISLNGYDIKIIWKLHRGTYYGGKHTSIDHLKQGFPSHSGKEIKNAIDKLVKTRIVIVEKKTNEEHVCLNKDKIKIIYQIVDWFINNMKLMSKEHLEETYLDIEIG